MRDKEGRVLVNAHVLGTPIGFHDNEANPQAFYGE